ncbi:MAG: hypothetical protein ACOYJX_09425 [Acutalibacteraceae bacterium]|jgi:hypothetical protein
MKKCFILIFAVLIIFSLASCNTSSEDKPQNSPSKNPFESPLSIDDIDQNHLSSIMSRIDNTNPYNELITKEIDIDLFIQKCDEDPTVALFTKLTFITKVDDEFGIECLRETESNSLYSVHKVKQGGLLYIFYRYHSGTGKYAEIKNWYYVKEKLNYRDFSSVDNGSDIKEVARIDPVTDVYIERANNCDKTKSIGMATHHYLEDGILMLIYRYKDGKFEVVEKDFRDEFTVELFFKEEKEEPYNGRVFPMDLLK